MPSRVAGFLKLVVTMAGDPKAPRGCFLICSGCEAGSHASPITVNQTINQAFSGALIWLTEFFQVEQKLGNLSKLASPNLLANSVTTLQSGLAIMARQGKSVSELNQIIDHTLTEAFAWV